MNRLDGKIAIVTGATSGIGEACARLFAQAGGKVVVVGRDEQRGQAIAEDIRSQGHEACFYQMDVTNDTSVSKLVESTIERYEKLDILFNNAGIFPPTPSLEEMTTELWDEIFDINSTGVFRLTKCAMPYLIKNRGVILNNASVAGMQSFASGKVFAYSASKAAVIQFTRMLAKVYGENVRVNCICPGVIDTPIYVNRDFSRYYDIVPMRRVGTAEEVAKAALFLVSDDASYCNGVILTVDGGQSL
jgi:NAD(P)-dependent dehydrogenase (short-subunit alcohol dehydrogenase family)